MTSYVLDNVRCTVGTFTLSIAGCTLDAGNVYSVVGPNGSGKSSLLNLLAFLAPASRGNLLFRNACVDNADGPHRLSLRRQVAYLMQNPYLFNMSVADNIGYGLRVRGCPKEDIRRRVKSIMERMSLTHLAPRNAHHLSGGEAQRVALARTLVLDTDVVLLDEPTANVDLPNVRALEKTVLDLCREKCATVVFTTHSLDQAYRMSGNRLSIINGRISGIAYENVFEGLVQRGGNGVPSVAVTEGVEFRVAAEPPAAHATIAVDPEDIVVSRARLTSSALNVFEGRIERMDATDGILRIYVDIGVSLCAVLTRKSFADMDLNIGKSVWVTFKASAVRIL
jgi:tungstate transport system ATP-binding protein